jgi:manganese transport protein
MLLLSGARKFMGKHANGIVTKSLGWLYFGIVTFAAVAALPLYFLTSGGNG